MTSAGPPCDRFVAGQLVTPDGIVPDGWLALACGRIAAIGTGPRPPAAAAEAGHRWVVPDGVDGQTHAGSHQGLKGPEPTMRSAVAGGVTALVDRPYNDPDTVARAPAAGRARALRLSRRLWGGRSAWLG